MQRRVALRREIARITQQRSTQQRDCRSAINYNGILSIAHCGYKNGKRSLCLFFVN